VTNLVGIWVWERHTATPGAIGTADPKVEPKATQWSLTVFAHSQCPCMAATLAELAEIVTASPDLVVHVRIVGPEGHERGPTWDAASRVAGVELARDDGTDARRHGAETSGHTVLADPNGHVLFRGGITRGRGRLGSSEGRRAIVERLAGRETDPATAPVFGCPLFDPDG
jgi:hypothetical protein